MSNPTIFLNYRHEDSEGYVGRLYDHLSRRFSGRVFRDVSNLRPGEDFVDALEREGRNCRVLLAVIGKHWLTLTDANGRRRIDDPNDILRQEIVRALERNICVIPVLVGAAGMPEKDELPPDLKALWRRQAQPITERDFEHDIEQLIAAIEKGLGEPATKKEVTPQIAGDLPAATSTPKRRNPLGWIVAGVVAAIVVFAIIGSLTNNQQASNSTNHVSPSTPYSESASTPATEKEQEKAFLKEITSNIAAIKTWRDRIRNLRTEPIANIQQMQSRARQLLSAVDSYDRELNNFIALLRQPDVQNLIVTAEDRRVASTLEQLCEIWTQQSTRIRYEAQMLLQHSPYNPMPYDQQAEFQALEREINALDVRSTELLQNLNFR